MSLFCTLDKSTSGVLVSTRPLLAFLIPQLCSPSYRRNGQNATRRPFSQTTRDSYDAFATSFVNCLVTAGHARHHLPNLPSTVFTSAQRPRRLSARPRLTRIGRCRRYSQGVAAVDRYLREDPNPTKKELLDLVDQYDTSSFTDQLPLLEHPNPRQSEENGGIRISDEPKDMRWPHRQYVWPTQGEEQKVALENLVKALENPSTDAETAFQLYRKLPAPRVPYLQSWTRHNLLHILAAVETKDEHAMLRYLSVVDDLKANNIPLTTTEWNSAIFFAGRYVSRTTDVEVEAGLRLWKEMENIGLVRGNNATFNILFDIAVKAGKFGLAELIHQEMLNRGLPFNRFHHVSQIHYCGLQRDGEGARKAYKELVLAGEIVDNVVLNCMISALISAGEPQAAEHIYERMKEIHTSRGESSPLPPTDYTEVRYMKKALVRLAELARKSPALKEKYHDQALIAPDTKTYRLLIGHYAVRAGELPKVVKLVEEMRWFDVPLHGNIFLALFKGFALHGGERYSLWELERLQSVWRAFVNAAEAEDNDERRLYVGKWNVIWAMRAFGRCGGKERATDVWEDVRGWWRESEADRGHVLSVLGAILEERDGGWLRGRERGRAAGMGLW